MMSRYASVLAVTLISFCWQAAVQGVFVKFQVQLALSDDDYASSGFIYGDIEETVSGCRVEMKGCIPLMKLSRRQLRQPI